MHLSNWNALNNYLNFETLPLPAWVSFSFLFLNIWELFFNDLSMTIGIQNRLEKLIHFWHEVNCKIQMTTFWLQLNLHLSIVHMCQSLFYLLWLMHNKCFKSFIVILHFNSFANDCSYSFVEIPKLKHEFAHLNKCHPNFQFINWHDFKICQPQ